jgi:drug/metabolite transporter (DMT)-like permease
LVLVAVVLVLLSAVLHAAWNLILKSGDDKLITAWTTILIAPVVLWPALLVTGFPPRDAWPILLVSGALHAGYNLALARAYEHGRLSVVYPVARGVAPLLVAIGAAVFAGERLNALGFTGVALATGGIVWVGVSGLLRSDVLPGLSRASASLKAGSTSTLGWALLTAACISAYTLIDKAGVGRAHPVAYILFLYAWNAALMTPFVLAGRDRAGIVAVWRARPGRLLASGLCSVGAYLLVLFAMRLTAVSYVAALRESSVVFAALLGWIVLDEPLGRGRLMASAIVAAGLVLLSVAMSSAAPR